MNKNICVVHMWSVPRFRDDVIKLLLNANFSYNGLFRSDNMTNGGALRR
jgi:hypothetical protein